MLMAATRCRGPSRKTSNSPLNLSIASSPMGVISRVDESIWKSRLPLKIKIFMWQLRHNKLSAAVVLKRRGWKGDIHCSLCGAVEISDHIFFRCPLATYSWCCLRDTFGWYSFPTSTADFMESWLHNALGVHKALYLFIYAGFLWATWRKRNKMAIEKTFPKHTSEVMLYIIFFLQKWEVLLKDEDRSKLAQVRNQVSTTLHNVPISGSLLSNVGEI